MSVPRKTKVNMMTWTDNITSWASGQDHTGNKRTYNVVDVETRVSIVEGQESIDRQLGTEVVVFSGKHLFTHTGSDFGLEIQDRTKTEISAFTTLVVFRVLDSSTSSKGHHTSEDIFVEM